MCVTNPYLLYVTRTLPHHLRIIMFRRLPWEQPLRSGKHKSKTRGHVRVARAQLVPYQWVLTYYWRDVHLLSTSFASLAFPTLSDIPIIMCVYYLGPSITPLYVYL